VSLIEKAIEKMRAADAGVSSASRGRPVARPIVAAARIDVAPEIVEPAPVAVPAKQITVDRVALRAAEYAPEEGCETRFANFYRHIKRPILERAFAAAQDPQWRVVLLTSALSGDGKTFTSINLALSMARERDSSVLLIDGDVPKPNISRILGIQRERGLLDAAVNETVEPESLVLRTDIPGLEVMSAGTPVEHASELLTSARTRAVILELVANNPRRIVLLDAPPLLLSSEARSLLTLPGQIVVVVRAGRTPRGAIREAMELVDEDKLTGLILNEGQGRLSDGYYGYDYYGSGDNPGAKGG
jgi:protein-tyrosine kinase